MTTEKTKIKNDGLIAFITTMLRKSVDLPSDVNILANSVKLIAEEISKLSKNVSYLSKIVQEHDKMMSQIVTVQTYILNNMKNVTVDTQLPDLNGSKSEKPN